MCNLAALPLSAGGALMETMIERLDEMEEDLAARAFLFDHPQTYREAIQIAFRQFRSELSGMGERKVALG
jgi:phage regulator Rha-like protein